MAHSAQSDGPQHRTREIVIGVLALVVAIPVIVVLILALRHPDGRKAIDSTVGASAGTSAGTSAFAPLTGTSGSVSTTPPQSGATGTPPPVQTSTSTKSTSTTSTSAAPTSPTTSPPVVAGRLPLIVLNNTAASGASALAISRFQAGGWTATDGGAFEGDILSTVAYYDPDADGSKAAALALQQQFPAIQRVVPAFAGLPNGPVVVVLTSDYH